MDLESRFVSALRPYALSTTIKSMWQQLVNAYGESFRKYHNLAHLEEMFGYYELHKNLIQNKETLVMAIFHHDFVYEIWKKNNEEKSAEKAIHILKQTEIPFEKLQPIEDLIMCTKHHIGLTSDQSFMIDFDLAVLGQSSQVYFEYTQQIRREYKIVPDLIYKKGRKKVLQHFLSKKSIFQTDVFQSKYERQARINLTNELKML